ncbi:MAG: helix-turn-helix domain-containing protein [Marinilabiliaceae bacterium]|nr:helix-turn-helix domain-containing protein [Marinilabiliaceae bacterium]
MLNQYTIDGLTIPELLKETGISIKRKRINKQFKQKTLAEKAGVNVNTIIALENGKNIGFDKFLTILRELGELPNFFNFCLKPEPILPSIVFKTKNKEPKRVRDKNN